MIAVVVGRAATQRSADHLADRFAKAHGRTYVVDRIGNGTEFQRRPYAVLFHVEDASEAQYASLETYDCE